MMRFYSLESGQIVSGVLTDEAKAEAEACVDSHTEHNPDRWDGIFECQLEPVSTEHRELLIRASETQITLGVYSQEGWSTKFNLSRINETSSPIVDELLTLNLHNADKLFETAHPDDVDEIRRWYQTTREAWEL